MNKKSVMSLLCVALVTSLVASSGLAAASKAGFEHTAYQEKTAATIDGQWTTNDEWDDAEMTTLQASDGGANGNAYFRDKWLMNSGGAGGFQITTSTIVEVTTDTVENAGDYVEICIDSTNAGGTAPKAAGTDTGPDYRIVFTPTTVTWYQGDGAGWAAMATPDPAMFSWATTISASPWVTTPHRIYEFQYDKTGLDIGDGSGYISMRVAAYDADNAAEGVRAWPTSSNSVPDDWGYIPWSQDDIPENFGFVAVALLSCFAVVVGTIIYRKHNIK